MYINLLKKWSGNSLLFCLAFSVVTAFSIANADIMQPNLPLIQLKYERDFDKTTNNTIDCSYPDIKCLKGVDTYNFKEEGDIEFENYNAHSIHIVSRATIMKYGLKEHKIALKQLNLVLDDKESLSVGSHKVYNIMRLFNDCLDYACPVIGPVDYIKIPNVDEAKVFLTMDGQDVLGSPVVRILGRKNDNYFLMTGKIIDSNIDMAMQKCTDQHDTATCYTVKQLKAQDKCVNTQHKAQETCYLDYMRNTELIQTKIKDQQDVLLRKFVIE